MTGAASAKPFTLYEDGFEDDRFGRSTAGERLSAVLVLGNSPLVIALHGAWGTGKIHFLQRWVGAHAQGDRTATTLYFDAFASDYQSDPLVAALAGRLPKQTKVLNKIKKAVVPFLKSATRVGLAAATGGASEILGAAGDAAVEAGTADVGKALDTFWAREEGRTQAMAQFRAALGELTGTEENPTPLVIVIDELDRCRPDYALELLEVIKHFFEVPRVHFVLGVNLDALENAVRARYGAGIEAEEYLRKFISFRVTLPAVTGHDNALIVLDHAKTLVQEMGLSDRWREDIIEALTVAARGNTLTMRDIDKIMAQMTLLPVVKSEKKWLRGWVRTACDLLVMKVVRTDLYEGARQAKISLKQIDAYFGSTEESRIEMLDDKPNPRYDHSSTLHRDLWRWLSGDMKRDDDRWGDFARMFQEIGVASGPQVVTRCSRKWLEILTLA